MSKFIDVSQIQAGDTLVFNKQNFTCEYVENYGYAVDLQLHDSNGNKVLKSLPADEKVNLEF